MTSESFHEVNSIEPNELSRKQSANCRRLRSDVIAERHLNIDKLVHDEKGFFPLSSSDNIVINEFSLKDKKLIKNSQLHLVK